MPGNELCTEMDGTCSQLSRTSSPVGEPSSSQLCVMIETHMFREGLLEGDDI